jgi:hypothetical protein
MKKFAFLCLLLAGILPSFTPNSGKDFNYQTIARNNDRRVVIANGRHYVEKVFLE